MFHLSFYFIVVKILRVIFQYPFEQWFERWNIPLFWKMALSKKEIIVEQMTNNIDEPFSIVIYKLNSFSFNSNARGYHVYINIWNPVNTEVLVFPRETDNRHDNYSASTMYNLYIVWHISLILRKAFWNVLLLPGSTVLYTVTGQKINSVDMD